MKYRPENKGHDTDPGHRDDHGRVVLPLVVKERGDDAERDAQGHAEEKREEAEFQRHWKRLRNQGRDFASFQGERVTEVSVNEDIFPVVGVLTGVTFTSLIAIGPAKFELSVTVTTTIVVSVFPKLS